MCVEPLNAMLRAGDPIFKQREKGGAGLSSKMIKQGPEKITIFKPLHTTD
jgi:hypothetical protein